jgi:septal ring factor EnvC (AmiA/AmiB activator)
MPVATVHHIAGTPRIAERAFTVPQPVEDKIDQVLAVVTEVRVEQARQGERHENLLSRHAAQEAAMRELKTNHDQDVVRLRAEIDQDVVRLRAEIEDLKQWRYRAAGFLSAVTLVSTYAVNRLFS